MNNVELKGKLQNGIIGYSNNWRICSTKRGVEAYCYFYNHLHPKHYVFVTPEDLELINKKATHPEYHRTEMEFELFKELNSLITKNVH